MVKLFFLKLLCFLIVLFYIVPIVSRPVSASHKVFQDNFNDGNADGWIVTRNPCRFNGLPAEWKVVNGKLGIKINGGGCVTEIMPSDILWNSLGNDYIVEFDMVLVSGTDHNFAFRYTDPAHWYDFHVQSPNKLVLQRMLPPLGGSNEIFGDFSNNQTIHFKLIVQGEHLRLYRGMTPGILLVDNFNMGGFFPTGRIALQASAGANPSSETYFDNIVVTSIDDILPVPYYSQNELPWGPSEYDHAASLGFSNTTMNRWGCAVTSVAMVLNYHNMMEFPDGTPINPGTLNDWLKDHNGYLTGRDQNGETYSYLVWAQVGELTKDLVEAGKSSVKLEHRRAYPSSATTTLLDEDLTVRKIPDILQVKNASTSGHFVVATGKNGNIYTINDPEWKVPDLSAFGNTYTQVDRYLPADSNLSYMVAVVNPRVELLLTDPQGRSTGNHILPDGQSQAMNDIPSATYAFEAPVNNPGEESTQLGTGVNAFLLPTPENGEYHVQLSSKTEEEYTLNIAMLDKNGNVGVEKVVGVVNASGEDMLDLSYSQDSPSHVERIVTFQSAIEDVNAATNLKLISKKYMAKFLNHLLQQGEKYEKKGKEEVAYRMLNFFESYLDKERGKGIQEDAYHILLYDVTYLKSHL